MLQARQNSSTGSEVETTGQVDDAAVPVCVQSVWVGSRCYNLNAGYGYVGEGQLEKRNF